MRWPGSTGSRCGSELEAALDELRLLRELRPPANARGTRPDRHVYLRRRGDRWICGTEPTPHGPISGRSLARRAAQALDGFEGDDPRDVLPGLRLRLRRLAGDLRFEDAARLRDRIAALEQVVDRIDELARLRAMRACLVVPALEPGMVRAVFVAGRVVTRRTVPRGGGAHLEVDAGLSEVDRHVPGDLEAIAADELLLLATFMRRPAPELRVVALERERDPRGDERGSLGCVSMRTDDEAPAVAAFSDRVAEAVERKRSQLVVGLDPRVDLLPVELRGEAVLGRAAAAAAVERFCKGIIDVVAPYAVAVKPQVAFFEALGSDGWVALEAVSRYAAEVGLLVIADGKRGDIGSTARAYAAAFLEPRGSEPPLADALTVNPYLGTDSMDPFLSACRNHGAGLFVLVRTSNAGGRDLQEAVLSDGTTVWRHVAGLVAEWGADLVGERGHVERRRRRRCDRAAGDRRCATGDAAGDHPAARRRRAGSDPGRRRPRIHERACERARQRVALGDLRLPRRRGRLACRRRDRGGAARCRDLGCLRLVAAVARHMPALMRRGLLALAVVALAAWCATAVAAPASRRRPGLHRPRRPRRRRPRGARARRRAGAGEHDQADDGARRARARPALRRRHGVAPGGRGRRVDASTSARASS